MHATHRPAGFLQRKVNYKGARVGALYIIQKLTLFICEMPYACVIIN